MIAPGSGRATFLHVPQGPLESSPGQAVWGSVKPMQVYWYRRVTYRVRCVDSEWVRIRVPTGPTLVAPTRGTPSW